jgi:PAS domain S-box-containing protein
MAHPFPLSKKDYPSLCPLTGMEPGNHLCCLYRTDEEHRAVITQCIRCGLERNEKVLSIVDSRVKDLIPEYIRDDGIDPTPYLQSGQLEIHTVQEYYGIDGVFDPKAMIRQLAASTEAAVSEGYSALRVINEMALAPGNLSGRDRLIEYETLLNTFLPGSRCLMVCLYDRRSVPSDILLETLLIHPNAVIGRELIENLSFIQPDEFSTKDRWSVLLDHWIENLKERNRLIRTLTHEKEIAETYLDVAGVMMVALDTKGTVLMANQKTFDLLGIPKSDLIGENWFDRAIPERLREEMRLVHSRLIVQDEGADLFFDNPVLTKEGEERIIAWYNTLLRDDTGLVIGTLSSGEDVTELRIAEEQAAAQHEALLESEHRLSDIIDFLPDATFAIDENGVVIAWNHAIEEMTGVSAEEMIGQGEYAYALPFYGKRQPMLIDLAFKDDPALRSRYDLLKEMPDVIEAETRYARPRGEERTLWGRVSPLHDRQGRNVGAIETIRDITDRKQSEALVKESEIRYRRLFEAAKDGILILDEDDGTIIDANPFILEMLGYRLEELLGRTVSEIGFIHDTKFAEEAFLRLKEEGYIRYEDLPLETKDGRLMEVEFISNRYAINDHSVIQCNIRDITERKHAEAALRLSESLKNHILAAVPDILIRSDSDGRYLDILTPDDDRFILPKADLIGRTITDVTSEEIGSRLTEAIRLALSSEEMQTVEYTLTVPAGKLHFEARIVPYLKDEVIALIRDITDRKIAEEELRRKNEELATAEEELRSQLEDLVATQQQLRESEAYIRTVLDNLPIGIAVNSVDPEVNFEYFNENFFRIYRTTAEALQRADAFWDVVYEDPDFRSELRERVLADGISGDPDRMQWEDIPVTRKGEETTYISARNIPVPGKDLVISTVWDVTGRVEAEARVRLHLIRVQHLLNLHRMTDATEPEIFNSTLDAGLAMVESRYAFIGMIGVDESEMIIHAWSQDTMEDCTVIDKPMHFPIASAGIWGECVRNRKPAVFNEYAASHPAKHGYPEGHVPITRYLGVPIFDGSRIVAVLAVANKVSEYRDDDIDALMTLGNAMWGLIHRRRFDAVLRESEEKYRLLVENQQDLVIKTDSKGRFLYANPAYCRLFGKTEEELIGAYYMPLVHPDDRAVVEAAVALLFKPPYECSYEERAETSLGWRWLEWTARAWHDDNGETTAFVGTGRDITDRKLAEEKLRQFEWIVEKELPPAEAPHDGSPPVYGDLTVYNTSRIILDGVGGDHLARMATDVMLLLDTSLAVYESNGDYAYGVFESSWCRFLDEAAFRLCGVQDAEQALTSGRWLCHENCWNESAKTAMESGEPTDIGCVGGIRLYAVPILAGGEVIGAVNIGYGNPPKDDATLRMLAGKYHVSPDELHEKANSYKPRPDFIIELGKRRCQYMAEMIGGIIERNRAEEALKQSEERYRSVSTLISDFAYSCVREDGGEYRIDWMVGAIDRISGYEINEVIAEGCWGFLVHPDDRRIFEEEILSLATGASSDCEFRIVRRDGGIRWLRAVTRSAPDEGGRSRIYGGCRDVTEEKTALLELEMSHARLESAMEAGGIAWWEMDCLTGDVAFSPRKAEMLGYSPDRFSHYTDFTDLIHPEDKEKAMQAMRDHLEGRAERYEVEYRIRNNDGSYLWLRDLGSVSDRGEGGAPLKVVGLVINITLLKEADEALRESEALLSTAGRITHFGGWSVNLAEQRVIWSDEVARIHGMDPGYSPSIDEEISYYAPEWKEKISSVFQECLRNGISYDEEMEIINATGGRRWVRTTGEAIRDSEGEIVGIHGALQDITRKKEAEEAWKKAYAQIEENMYKFSILNDQIRNPLAVIMALVDLEGGEYADRIMDQVKAIDRIITLLDQGVLESESTRAFMRKHDQLSG